MAKGGGGPSLVCDDGGALLHGELVLVDGHLVAKGAVMMLPFCMENSFAHSSATLSHSSTTVQQKPLPSSAFILTPNPGWPLLPPLMTKLNWVFNEDFIFMTRPK